MTHNRKGYYLNYIILLLAHFIGDYALQNDYMALNKGKDNYVLFAHVATWTITISAAALLLGLPVNAFMIVFVLLVPHEIMDFIKARNLLWCKSVSPHKALVIDQVFHLVQITVFYMLLSA